MSAGRGPGRTLAVATIAALCGGLFAGQALAQGNTGKLSVSAGADFSHAYLFRGIAQERSGVVAQPYFDLTASLFEGDQGLNSVTVSLGQWNSLHTGPSGNEGPAANVGAWYESDFYTGVGIGVDSWEFGLTYTAYLSPNDSFGTVKEIALSLAMDDSALLGRFALSPHVLMAIEVDGEKDGGGGEGVYLELGVEPGYAIEGGRLPLSLTFPVTLGISMSDYYEASPGDDDAFGYVSLGIVGSTPIPISDAYGTWEVSAGVHLLSLGDALTSFNAGDEFQPVATFGVGISY